MEQKDRLHASEIMFIDPLDCGSTVGYHITTTGAYTRYFEGTVDLTDCNRKVTWEFNEKTSPEKIDNAIKILTNFKKEFAKARKVFLKEKEIEDAKKKSTKGPA